MRPASMESDSQRTKWKGGGFQELTKPVNGKSGSLEIMYISA